MYAVQRHPQLQSAKTYYMFSYSAIMHAPPKQEKGMPPKKKVLFKVDQGKPVKVSVDITQGLKDRLDAVNDFLGQRNQHESLELQEHVPEFIEQLVSKAEKELGITARGEVKKAKGKAPGSQQVPSAMDSASA